MEYEVGKFYVQNPLFMPVFYMVVEAGEEFIIVCNIENPTKHEAFRRSEGYRLHEIGENEIRWLKQNMEYAQGDYEKARDEMYHKEVVKGYYMVALQQAEEKKSDA